MQPTPSEISTCPTCGGALEKTHGGGLGCPVCLLRAAIGVGDSAAESGEDSTASGRFGVYEIERREDGSFYELGHGGMGATYRAIDTTLQRKVALKIIKIGVSSRSTEARERFLREARAAAALRHEHIATVFQFGISEETGQFFYAMELPRHLFVWNRGFLRCRKIRGQVSNKFRFACHRAFLCETMQRFTQ